MDKNKEKTYRDNISPEKLTNLEDMYRFLANKFHPDKTGDRMGIESYTTELNKAREEALVGNPENLKKLYEDYTNKKIDRYA